jgi:hypothetical protein
MRVFTAALAFSLVVPLSTLSAQQPPSVGDRVRVTHGCTTGTAYGGGTRRTCQTDSGLLVTVTANSLAVAEGTDETVFALDSVSSLEVSSGKRRRVGRSMLIGSAIGGGVGALIGAIYFANDCSESGVCSLAGAAVGAIVGVPLGLLVGGVAGAFVKTDRWEEVPLDRLRVSFAPKRDGFAFGLSVAF